MEVHVIKIPFKRKCLSKRPLRIVIKAHVECNEVQQPENPMTVEQLFKFFGIHMPSFVPPHLDPDVICKPFPKAETKAIKEEDLIKDLVETFKATEALLAAREKMKAKAAPKQVTEREKLEADIMSIKADALYYAFKKAENERKAQNGCNCSCNCKRGKKNEG